jgi:hypothetical protein
VVLYMCVGGIVTKPVPRQKSDWSCICVLGVSLPSLHKDRKVSGHVYDTPNTHIHDHSLSWFDTPSTHIHDLTLSWLGTGLATIPPTHIYMTTNFPGLVQAW